MSKPQGKLKFLWAAPASLGAATLFLASCGPPVRQAPPMPLANGPVGRAGEEHCVIGSVATALRNGQSVRTLPITAFHRPETGWEIYAPHVAHEIGTACDAASPAFAHDLAVWQLSHGLAPSGIMDGVTFLAMKLVWDARRPFEAASLKGCPGPPDPDHLARVPPAQSYGGKVMYLRPRALAAYERMLAAARSESPAVQSDARLMTVFSAFRSPADDDARCLAEGNCQGMVRASCSAHRTGLAIDLDLGTAPGETIGSADDVNRLFISRGQAYRWMVANAGRFGFVNYAFEPWHWEWTGEAP